MHNTKWCSNLFGLIFSQLQKVIIKNKRNLNPFIWSEWVIKWLIMPIIAWFFFPGRDFPRGSFDLVRMGAIESIQRSLAPAAVTLEAEHLVTSRSSLFWRRGGRWRRPRWSRTCLLRGVMVPLIIREISPKGDYLVSKLLTFVLRCLTVRSRSFYSQACQTRDAS
jgi:hypothetical protein